MTVTDVGSIVTLSFLVYFVVTENKIYQKDESELYKYSRLIRAELEKCEVKVGKDKRCKIIAVEDKDEG